MSICSNCADRGHCEWFCGGACFTPRTTKMIYILSPIKIQDLANITWECDKYGNRSDENGNYYDYDGFMKFINIDPFVLTRDEEEFNTLKDAIRFFYPDIVMYEYTLGRREFTKTFPLCWYNIPRAVHFKKIDEKQDKELEEMQKHFNDNMR